MSTEQLPVNIIREAEWPEGAGGNPLDAVLNEHTQRLTLQHHAADQVWRIADLEVKCITLNRLHDAAADERDALRARLAEIEAQEPVAQVEVSVPHLRSIVVRSIPGAEIPAAGLQLYARPVPAQAVPMSDERIDAIAESVIKGMPDGILGFMRTWGYQQFARALLEVCAGHYRAQAVPDGWRLVPVEPTIAMCIAGDSPRMLVDDCTPTPAIYRAMIAAAPEHKA